MTRTSRLDAWLVPAVAAVVAVIVNVLLEQATDVPMLLRWLIAAAVGVGCGLAIARMRARRSGTRGGDAAER